MSLVRSAAAAVLAALSASAVAESLESVVVTATRTDAPRSRVLAPSIVVTRDQLDLFPATDVADVLRIQTGLEIARNGGPGQPASLFIRGADSNHALVLVDGVRINPGTIGGAALENIDPASIERIEVIKGPRSAVWGTDAIGGVVNVITRRATRSGADVSLGAGHYGTRTAGGNAALVGDAGAVVASVNWLDADGFATRRFDKTERGYRNLSATLNATTEIGVVELAVRGWHSEGTSEYSDFFATPVDQDYRNTSLAAEAGWQATSAWRTRLRVSNFQSRIEQNQSDDFVETRRWQTDWQNDVAAGEHHLLTFGVVASWEHADTIAFGSGFAASTNTQLVYAQDQIQAGRNRLLLAAGYTDHSTFGGHTTWNVEYGFALRDEVSLYASTGTAFRAPDATDRFGFGGNPDLDPERSRQYEVGLRGRIGERQTWSVAGFRNAVTDLIQFVTVSFDPFVGENRNVERARITGVDLDWQYTGDLWMLRAGMNLQNPRDLSNDGRLLRRARRNTTFAISRRIGDGRFGIDVLAAGDRRDFGFPEPVRLGGYVLANLSAQWTFADRFTLTARVENLFDRDYELASGYNTPGRSLFASLRYSLR